MPHFNLNSAAKIPQFRRPVAVPRGNDNGNGSDGNDNGNGNGSDGNDNGNGGSGAGVASGAQAVRISYT